MTAIWPSDLLRNDVAVVTGAGQGIGLAIARELVAAGACVRNAAKRDPDRLSRAVDQVHSESGTGTVEGFVVDVTQVDAVHAAVSEARDRFGEISILVNNAGVNA